MSTTSKTQLKIVATGADIFNIFWILVTASFSTYLVLWIWLVAISTPVHLMLQFLVEIRLMGFFEGQYYRLRVTYNVCGNFTGGNGSDVEILSREPMS
ncbi:MAG: hypothetical protein IPG39_01175 [Bacteroidetes bacterium]|nr:hypothetical protein [Bacteroidota bacterium]